MWLKFHHKTEDWEASVITEDRRFDKIWSWSNTPEQWAETVNIKPCNWIRKQKCWPSKQNTWPLHAEQSEGLRNPLEKNQQNRKKIRDNRTVGERHLSRNFIGIETGQHESTLLNVCWHTCECWIRVEIAASTRMGSLGLPLPCRYSPSLMCDLGQVSLFLPSSVSSFVKVLNYTEVFQRPLLILNNLKFCGISK